MSNTIAMFSIAAFVTVASPGPTSLLALNNGAHWGLKAALPGIAGAALSDLVLIGSVALGLGALVAATPWALEALRWAGVVCLAWLGLQLLRSSVAPQHNAEPSTRRTAAQPTRVLLRSFSVAVSNPKGYLFFLALLPAFINPQAPAWEQYLGLAVTFAAIDTAVLLAYASAGALGASRLGQTPKGARRLDRFSGLVLLCMATALVLWEHS